MFYTYIYRDPSRGSEPIYVGKGHGRRARQHLSRHDTHPFTQRLQKMKREGVEPTIEIINAIDEDHAYFLEDCLVTIFGRKDLQRGSLLNITDGGRGSKKGHILSAETRQRLSDVQKGKRLSEEHKMKIGLGMLGKPQTAEKGRRISETKQRLRAEREALGLKCKKWSQETKDRVGTKGKPWTQARRDAAGLKGRPWSEARRAAQEARK